MTSATRRPARSWPAGDRCRARLLDWSTRPWFPAACWVTIATVLIAAQHLSARVLRGGYRLWPPGDWNYYLSGWSQFDGPEYLAIAADGYWYTPGVESPIVWFPLYPLLLRATDAVLSEPVLSGVLVASVAGIVAVTLYWRWLAVQGLERGTRLVAFATLLLYPYGWYLYGVVHSDAVFLAATLGAFLLVEARRPVLAGLVGALATAARPTGMALLPALMVLQLERDGVLSLPAGSAKVPGWARRFSVPLHVDLRRLRWRSAGPLLAVAGIGAYMWYLGTRFGDPWAFRTNQRVYHPEDLPMLKRAFLVRWRDIAEDPTYTLTITAQAAVIVGTALSAPFVGRRFGWGYGVFVAVLVAIPTVSTGDFMGSGRYLIAAFPTAALAGTWLARRRHGWRWLAASGTAMLLLSMGFARSWYLT